MEPDLIAAVGRYGRRLHAGAGETHHVVSPLGTWILLALCAPLRAGAPTTAMEEFLGMDLESAFTVAAALLCTPHPWVPAAAAVWTAAGVDPEAGDSSLEAWLARLPEPVARGPIPSPADLDEWAFRHSLELIRRFHPTDPDPAILLAGAVATKVSWLSPFTVVLAQELGAASPWSGQLCHALRTPYGARGHNQWVTDTPEAGLVGVALADAAGGLVVGSEISLSGEADPAEVSGAAARIVAARAQGSAAGGTVSLFDLPLGDGPVLTNEEYLDPAGARETVSVDLPAWEATTTLDLDADRLGFPAVARAIARAVGVDDWPTKARQTAAARFGAEGFEAAAITAIAFASSAARIPRPQVARRATLRFGHPYAVVAATSSTDQSHDRDSDRWHGLPVFSAWVTQPCEPH